jgi:hypothetical protein
MQFATIKGLRTEKYTLQSQNWRESAKTNKTTRLITARRNKYRYVMLDMLKKRAPRFAIYCEERMKHLQGPPISKVQDAQFDKSFMLQLLLISMKRAK